MALRNCASRRIPVDLTYVMANIAVDPVTGCWLWQKARNAQGYGQTNRRVEHRRGGRSKCYLMHRAAYALIKGAIPEGLELDHLCRVRACVNPDHLEAVTARVNSLRSQSWAARNAAKTACVYGHPFSPYNTRMRANGARICKECSRRRCRQCYYAKKEKATA